MAIRERLSSRSWRAVLALVLAGGLAGAASADDQATELRKELRQIIADARDRVFPALVNIHVVTVDYRGGVERKGSSYGSGTIIDERGHVLTNAHVALDGKRYRCTLADKQEIEATLVGIDPLTDLAVLQLNLAARTDPDAPVAVARFGDSSDVEIGDTVMAMGSPLALARSVTLGIVSNTERVFAGDDDAPEMYLDRHQRTGLFNRWIQHDAVINPGNSGGPLVNLAGEIIGVNTRGGSSMGFAVPSNLARSVAQSLIENGDVVRSWYGLSLRPIKRTGFDRGALVDAVVEDGPVFQAGMRAGDLLIKINDEPVTVRFAEEIPLLLKRLADQPVGEPVRLTYERDGDEHVAAVETVRMEKEAGDEAAFRAWGLTGQAITPTMARDLRLDGTAGVLVTGVARGGSAELAEPALNPGDVLRKVDRQPVDTLDQFIDVYEQIIEDEDRPEYVLVEFDRNGESQLTALKTERDRDPDPPREVPKAWIGIATQPIVPKLARQLGGDDQLGFRVTRVYAGTTAADADLAVGDVVVALNGERLAPNGMQDAGLFARRLRRLDIDEPATLTVLRDGQTHDVVVITERTRMTPAEARRERNDDFGMTVRELTFFDRDEQRWSADVAGVLIENVEPAGWAGLGGLRSGDLVQKIDGKPIRSLSAFRELMAEIAKRQPERVVFVVLRGPRSRYEFVEPEWSPVSQAADASNAAADAGGQ